MKTRDDLIAAARDLAAREGTRALGCAAFCRATGTDKNRVRKLFGSWTALCAAAGLETAAWQIRVPEEDIFAAMRETFLAAGRITTRTLFERGFRYSGGIITRRFRTWHAALSALRDWLAEHDPDFPLMDRLDARIAEGDTAPPPPAPPVIPKAWPSLGGREYGEIIGSHGFLHAPTSENGVIMLFGALATELGYVVESIRGAFPDCTAKRRLGPDRWERVRIEFEYDSRNFRDHGHDPAGCDLVVCWVDNWPGCPVEVLELRAALAALGRGTGASVEIARDEVSAEVV